LKPLISVVIPTVDRSRTVVRAVRSALAQTLSPIEVIVVVDGHDEATLEALREVEDPRLRVKLLPARVGAGAARNAGTAEACAEWVAFLDDDDEWDSRKLEIQLEAARSSSHPYPVISCRLVAREAEGDRVWPRRPPRLHEPISEYLFTRNRLSWGEGLVQTSTILTRKELLERVRFETGLKKHDDWDWLLRASALDGVEVAFVSFSEPLVIWNREQDRPRRSAPDWRFSVAWLRQNRQLVTPRAFASFLLTIVSGDAAQQHSYQAFWLLPWEAIRCGTPRALDLLIHLALWIVPPKLRRKDPFRRA
jgi:glycosyltransferase involved in cell wall biosynthesis